MKYLAGVMAITAACGGGGGGSGPNVDAPTADFVESASFDTEEIHLAAGDVDNDGDVDLYMVTDVGGHIQGYGSTTRLARNDGSGTLALDPIAPINGDCGRPRLENVNADNLLDVVCLPQSIGGATTKINQGQGAFLGAGHDSNTSATDARGWPALASSPLVAATPQGLIALSLVDETQQMPVAMTLATDGFTTLAVADLDGDGKSDLIAGKGFAWAVFSGADQSRRDFTIAPGFLETADLDRDGHPDILAFGDQIGISLVRDGAPTPPTFVDNPPMQADHFIVDYDGDGIPDVLFIGVGPQVYVMRGDASGTLSAPQMLSIAGTPVPTYMTERNLSAVADFDHDGTIDLAISDVQTHVVRIYKGR